MHLSFFDCKYFFSFQIPNSHIDDVVHSCIVNVDDVHQFIINSKVRLEFVKIEIFCSISRKQITADFYLSTRSR